MTTATRTRRMIRFRGRSFLALVLAPEPPLEDWLAELDELVGRSPQFFVGRLVVLDLSALPAEAADVTGLLAQLASRGIRIMAIEGREAADLGPDVPPLITGGRDARAIEPDLPRLEAPPPQTVRASLMLDKPVRSGQSISFPQGDVIVIGSVGWGAELVAGGSIHVYGTLRGRAIAGTVGDASARIFCRKLEAELLAIDGLYLTADGMNPLLRSRSAQIWLDGETMMMAALD